VISSSLAATTGVDPRLAPLAAVYVLLTAVSAPLLTRYADALLPRPRPPFAESAGRETGTRPRRERGVTMQGDAVATLSGDAGVSRGRDGVPEPPPDAGGRD